MAKVVIPVKMPIADIIKEENKMPGKRNFDMMDGAQPIELDSMFGERQKEKEILVMVGEVGILSQHKCPHYRTDNCDGCRLKFQCYLNKWVKLDYAMMHPTDVETPMEEKVVKFMASMGADVNAPRVEKEEPEFECGECEECNSHGLGM